MPRLRGSRRGRRKTNTFSDVSSSPRAQGSDEDSIPRTKPKLLFNERSTLKRVNSRIENEETRLQIEEDEEEMEVEEDEEYDDQDDEPGTLNSARRLTEGDIDVDDGESGSCDEDDDLNSGEAEAGDEDDSDDSLTPAEKAAKLCHLPVKELIAEELELFVFLETASRALKDSYLCIRNMACLIWSEDSSVQVTQQRLFNFTNNNLSVENLRLMLEAGLTTQPATQPDDLLIGATRSGRPAAVVVAGASSGIKELSTMSGSSSRLVNRQLAALSYPSNWNPWGSTNARSNLEHMCYLAILFLERYGYINYGIFKILATPLTHVTISPQSTTTCAPSGPDIIDSSQSTSLSSSTSSEAPLTPRRAAAERALAVTRRSSSSLQLNQVASNPPQPPPHIIVLGAGIAGLIAARQLTYFGAKVTLLESRDRVGGRIWTHKKGDMHCELGAIVIAGISANPISVLARQMSLHPTPVNTDCSLYDPKGRTVSRDMDEKIKQEFNRLLGTASYLCHTKSMDSITVGNGEERLLSLGEVLDLLIKYQQRHRLQLKVTHKRLIIKLVERKHELLDQISVERSHIETAYERWQTASAKANPCTVVVTPRVMSDASNTASGGGFPQLTSSPSLATTNNGAAIGSRRDKDKPASRSQMQCSSDAAEASDGNNESLSPKALPPVVYNVSVQFEVRRLFSELHEAWKKFEPMQTALTRVNRQLEILLQSPPRDVYLTDAERRIMEWHLANLEFANSTRLCNLSLRHWDQDGMFELAGEHCVLRDGYGSLVEGLASAITSGGGTTAVSSSNLTPNSKLQQQHQRECQPVMPTAAHIELRSSVKRIIYSDKGVRVEALNAAFSQDDLIGHDADALICTLPLGVLKESVRIQSKKQNFPQSPRCHQPAAATDELPDMSHLTRLTAPVFQPALPHWKVDAVNRLGFGVLNNVVLIFEKCFWDRSINLFGHVSSDASTRGELFLFWSISDKPILHVLVAGQAALDLEHEKVPLARQPSTSSSSATTSSPRGAGSASVAHHRLGGGLHEPIVGRAMQVLRGIFGQDGSSYFSGQQGQADRKKVPPNPVDAYVTRWQMDPDSRGSCSYVAVGSSGSDYNLLADPVPTPPAPASETAQKTSPLGRRSAVTPVTPSHRLFFAGEHTSQCYPATVHGALLTGLREAARVANTFFPGPTPIRQHNFKLTVGLSGTQ